MSVMYPPIERQDVINMIRNMKELVREAADPLGEQMAKEVAQALEDVAVVVYHQGYEEGQKNARN